MKRLSAIILAASLLLITPARAETTAAPEISAKAAIVIHADTREPLFELNADDRMLIASTTKIMTALVVLENCALDESVEIDSRSAGKEGSSMYLREGEEYTVEELLYGLMLASGNDAASALAIHAAGSEEDFAELMNEKAAELGLENTHFQNPHGLDAEGHYSTARDMAMLAAYAMENDDFVRIVSSRSANVHGVSIYNHNRLLSEYPGCIGVKTGYTMAAGRTLVSCAERDGTRFICVTLCDRDDWRDHSSLYDWAFENYEYRKLLSSDVEFRVPAVNSESGYATVCAPEGAYALLERGTEVDVSLELPPFVIAPVSAGETAGRVVYTSGGETICEAPLVYADDIEIANSPGFFGSIAEWFKGLGRPIYLMGD